MEDRKLCMLLKVGNWEGNICTRLNQVLTSYMGLSKRINSGTYTYIHRAICMSTESLINLTVNYTSKQLGCLMAHLWSIECLEMQFVFLRVKAFNSPKTNCVRRYSKDL